MADTLREVVCATVTANADIGERAARAERELDRARPVLAAAQALVDGDSDRLDDLIAAVDTWRTGWTHREIDLTC